MKVLMINGSPHAKGNTYLALQEMAAKFAACDGLVVGSPVYYASANATLVAFLTRLFFSTRFDKTMKVGAGVVVARRGGLSSTFDERNKFFTISGMPVASGQYWNSVHGREPWSVESAWRGISFHLFRSGSAAAPPVNCIRRVCICHTGDRVLYDVTEYVCMDRVLCGRVVETDSGKTISDIHNFRGGIYDEKKKNGSRHGPAIGSIHYGLYECRVRYECRGRYGGSSNGNGCGSCGA